jgi:secernin
MCDILVAMPDATKNNTIVFGKNSDRPVGEYQVLSYAPDGPRKRGNTIRCSYVTVPEAARVLATMGCRPYWCWGYETGMNEAGVVGGNVAVFTRSLWDPANREALGLTGMELLRLGLERGENAEEVIGIITNFLEEYGQCGSAVRGQNHREGSYENAFLVADRHEVWVLETTSRRWVAERVTEGVRSISNELSIRDQWRDGTVDIRDFAQDQGWWRPDDGPFDFAFAYSDHEHYSRQVSHIRRMRTRQLLDDNRGRIDVPAMMSMLRDHYEDTFLQGPQFHPFLPDFHTVCMHASPAGFTWGNTATSMVVEIDPQDSVAPPCWVCYLPPCTGIYMAFPFSAPLPETITRAGTAGVGQWPALNAPEDRFLESSLWWRFHRIIEAVRNEPLRRHKEVRDILDPLEQRYIKKVIEILQGPLGSRNGKFKVLVQDEVSEVTAALEILEERWGVPKEPITEE